MSGALNSNTVNSKFHFIRSFCEMFSYHFPIISCLKFMVNSYLHLFRRKSLPMNDFELTVHELTVLATLKSCRLIYIAGDGLGYGLGHEFLSYIEMVSSNPSPSLCKCSAWYNVAIGFGIRIRVRIRVRLRQGE